MAAAVVELWWVSGDCWRFVLGLSLPRKVTDISTKRAYRRKRKTTAERTQLDNITSFYGFPGNKMWVFDLIFAAFSRARLSSQKFYSLFALIFTISHTCETFTRAARVRAHPSPPRAPFERKTFLAHPNYGIYRLSALVDFVLCSFFRSDKVDDALCTWRKKCILDLETTRQWECWHNTMPEPKPKRRQCYWLKY